MIRNPKTRRVVSVLLLAAGGLFILLTPADFWVGAVLLGLGVTLEIIGTRMQRHTPR